MRGEIVVIVDVLEGVECFKKDVFSAFGLVCFVSLVSALVHVLERFAGFVFS